MLYRNYGNTPSVKEQRSLRYEERICNNRMKIVFLLRFRENLLQLDKVLFWRCQLVVHQIQCRAIYPGQKGEDHERMQK